MGHKDCTGAGEGRMWGGDMAARRGKYQHLHPTHVIYQVWSDCSLCRYRLRLLFDAVDMRWDWPVDVNYHEAKAYCAWRTEQDGSEVMYRVIR